MQEESETVRIEAFSDAVFAIAMTLLVIEIKVPSHDLVEASGLARSLIALWPSYLAFVTSFVTILVIWVHHHWIFALVHKYDHPFLYWNGLLLLFVTFVALPTALLEEHCFLVGRQLHFRTGHCNPDGPDDSKGSDSDGHRSRSSGTSSAMD